MEPADLSPPPPFPPSLYEEMRVIGLNWVGPEAAITEYRTGADRFLVRQSSLALVGPVGTQVPLEVHVLLNSYYLIITISTVFWTRCLKWFWLNLLFFLLCVKPRKVIENRMSGPNLLASRDVTLSLPRELWLPAWLPRLIGSSWHWPGRPGRAGSHISAGSATR